MTVPIFPNGWPLLSSRVHFLCGEQWLSLLLPTTCSSPEMFPSSARWQLHFLPVLLSTSCYVLLLHSDSNVGQRPDPKLVLWRTAGGRNMSGSILSSFRNLLFYVFAYWQPNSLSFSLSPCVCMCVSNHILLLNITQIFTISLKNDHSPVSDLLWFRYKMVSPLSLFSSRLIWPVCFVIPSSVKQ